MAEQKRITKLSETLLTGDRMGCAVVMVGSFAPIHGGHLDAVRSASTALLQRNIPVEALVLTPNSTEYVQRKLGNEQGQWTYERRIEKILEQEPHTEITTYVDDISGLTARHEQINDHVPITLRQHLGLRLINCILS